MYNILILTDEPEKKYEHLCFSVLNYYSELHNYDIMLRNEYYYDSEYDYIFYISNRCLIIDFSIKIENYINDRHDLQSYSNYILNLKNFIIIKNTEYYWNKLINLDFGDLYFDVNKKINYLSHLNINSDNMSNYKHPNFLKQLRNPFFFIYSEVELDNVFFKLNDVILDYIYNQLFNIFHLKKNYIENGINLNQYDYTQEKEVFNPGKKIAFVTMYTYNMKEEGIQSEYNIKKYCEKNNYTYYIHRKSEIVGRHFCLEKPYILQKYIKEHDYIIWVDADILMFDMDFKIESIFKENKSFYCFKDLNQYLNSGFLIFKNDEIGNNIIKEWIEKIEVENITEFRGYWMGDQGSLIEVITRKYIKNTVRDTKLEINIPIYYLGKNTKVLHIMSFFGFFRYLLLEYFNYVIFNLKYKELI